MPCRPAWLSSLSTNSATMLEMKLKYCDIEGAMPSLIIRNVMNVDISQLGCAP
jgi:hypothetical protein